MPFIRIPKQASKLLSLHYEEEAYIILETDQPKKANKIIFTRNQLEGKQIIHKTEVIELKRNSDTESNLFEPSSDAIEIPRKYTPSNRKAQKIWIIGKGAFQIILR
jgi:hypothetical protein